MANARKQPQGVGTILPNPDAESPNGSHTSVRMTDFLKNLFRKPYAAFPKMMDVDLTYIYRRGRKHMKERVTLLCFVEKENVFLVEQALTDAEWFSMLHIWRNIGIWNVHDDVALQNMLINKRIGVSYFLTYRKYIPLSAVREVKEVSTGRVEKFSRKVVSVK